MDIYIYLKTHQDKTKKFSYSRTNQNDVQLLACRIDYAAQLPIITLCYEIKIYWVQNNTARQKRPVDV